MPLRSPELHARNDDDDDLLCDVMAVLPFLLIIQTIVEDLLTLMYRSHYTASFCQYSVFIFVYKWIICYV